MDDVNEKFRNIIASSIKGQNSEPLSEKQVIEESPSTKELIEEKFDLNETIPALSKEGVDFVQPMNAQGLNAIRFSLQGLNYSVDKLTNLSPHLQNKDPNSSNYVDFLQIYDSLGVDSAKRKEFEAFMNAINQERQQIIEARGYEAAREKWRKDFEKQQQIHAAKKKDESSSGQTTSTAVKGLETLLWQWNEAMLPLVREEIKRIKSVLEYSVPHKVPSHLRSEGPINVTLSDRFEYGPYLLRVNPENLPAITMLELLNLNSTGGVSEGMRTARAVLAVGKTVEMEFRTSVRQKRERNALKGFHSDDTNNDNHNNNNDNNINTNNNNDSTLASIKMAVNESDLNAKLTSWPTTVRAKIGSLLISMLLQVAKIKVTGRDPVDGSIVEGKAPAFFHSYQYQNGSKVGVLKTHKNLAKHLSGEVMAAAVQPQRLPMLVKPRPWTAWNNGGYLYSSSKIMRSKDSPEQTAYLKAASDRGQLNEFYKGLNVLGETAWTVNREILKVILNVWNSGEKFLDIPPQVDLHVEYPHPPPRDADPSLRRDWKRRCRFLYNENQQLFSQRCDANYKLEIARAFLGERFYLPHNVDFRGRAYPLSPHLNHLGNDMSRGLLLFWDGKELGLEGLKWLKIHLANVYGNNKFSFEDRCQFIDDNIDLVLDSANSPLDGKKWWQEAENPWQTLAASMELRNALALDDPTKFVSRIPVHQDGTCNGLQHYAALGGDIEGAKEVNLVPSSKPQDVYSSVLQIVEKKVQQDAELGLTEAKLAVDKLSRRLIKQTVMTNVYGVTFIGARQQITSKLKDFKELDRHQVYKVSSYLAANVLESVRSLFEGAHLIQDWLGDNATLIARSVRLDMSEDGEFLDKQSTDGRTTRWKKSIDSKNLTGTFQSPNYMSSVIWTTPLGLPIVQPYRKERRKQVVTSLQSVFISDPYALRGVNSRKQKTAFPPNYIHSLDATHMLLSAIGCGENNVTFAAVHDSYWTHAGNVDRMNQILRSSFIRLHEIDLIQQLREEFIQRYSGLLHVVEIPKYSDLGIQIKELTDKFAQEYGTPKLSLGQLLDIERTRMHLINSSNPDDVENGEMMITPVSLVQSYPSEKFEDLVNEANNIKLAKKSKKDSASISSQYLKFTEHEGTGSDRLNEIMADNSIEEEPEESEDEGFVMPKSPMAASAETASSGKLSSTSSTVMQVLVPLQILKVPPKGDFDVRQLKDSKYFFS